MVGRKLTERLVRDGRLGKRDITRMTLQDVVAPAKPDKAGFPVDTVTCDFAVPVPPKSWSLISPMRFSIWRRSSPAKPNSISTRAIVSISTARGCCSMRSGRSVAAISPGSSSPRRLPYSARHIRMRSATNSSRRRCRATATQKTIGELLLADYSRRGFMDGIGIRLPTICIRPGLPNKAASGFFSNILREPLSGKEAILPVPEDVRHWHASPRSAVGFLIHAATMDTATAGPRRNLPCPDCRRRSVSRSPR